MKILLNLILTCASLSTIFAQQMKMPVIEYYGSSNCLPCPAYYQDNIAPLEATYNFNSETNAKAILINNYGNLYDLSINATTQCATHLSSTAFFPFTNLQGAPYFDVNEIQQIAEEIAPLDIVATYSLNTDLNTISVNTNLKANENISGDHKLFIYVLNKEINHEYGGSGQTNFTHVMRVSLLPFADSYALDEYAQCSGMMGEPLPNSISLGQELNYSVTNFNYELYVPDSGVTGDWFFDHDVEVVVLVREGDFGEILHAAVATSGTVSTQEHTQTQFSIYPNPSNGAFSIDIKEDVDNIKITDIQSREVWSGNFKNTIDPQLPKGMYFVELYNNNLWLGVQKLVIE